MGILYCQLKVERKGETSERASENKTKRKWSSVEATRGTGSLPEWENDPKRTEKAEKASPVLLLPSQTREVRHFWCL